MHLVSVLCEVKRGQCLGPSQLSILWYPLQWEQGSRRWIILRMGNGFISGDAQISSSIAQYSKIRKILDAKSSCASPHLCTAMYPHSRSSHHLRRREESASPFPIPDSSSVGHSGLSCPSVFTPPDLVAFLFPSSQARGDPGVRGRFWSRPRVKSQESKPRAW